MSRTPSYLLGSSSAVCHSFTARVGARQLRFSLPSSSARSSQRSRALHSSQRSAPYRQWLRLSHIALPQGILFWVLLAGAGISNSIYNAKPLLLESDESSNCLVQSRANKSISHPHRLLQLNESTRHYEWGKTRKSLELVVVFFAMIPCSFPVIRYRG